VRRAGLAAALLLATVVAMPMLWGVLVTGSIGTEEALRRYAVVLVGCLFAGAVLTAVFPEAPVRAEPDDSEEGTVLHRASAQGPTREPVHEPVREPTLVIPAQQHGRRRSDQGRTPVTAVPVARRRQ
jgi:hypothetical protein